MKITPYSELDSGNSPSRFDTVSLIGQPVNGMKNKKIKTLCTIQVALLIQRIIAIGNISKFTRRIECRYDTSTPTIQTDFTDGKMVAIYRQADNGNYNIVKMYPNSK